MIELIQRDIELVFSSPEWTSKNIEVVPDGFELLGEGIKFFISYDARSFYYGGYGVTGRMTLSIYVEAGRGQTRANEIAEDLNAVFQGRILSPNQTQTGPSTLVWYGVDPDNHSLARAEYSLPFSKYA